MTDAPKDEVECPACRGSGLIGGYRNIPAQGCRICGETGVVTEARAQAYFDHE